MMTQQAVNVVGIVVHAAPDRADEVRTALSALQGVDVHASTVDGRIVATAIDTDDVMAIDQLAAMSRTPGVVAAMLAYHQTDHAPTGVANAAGDVNPVERRLPPKRSEP